MKRVLVILFLAQLFSFTAQSSIFSDSLFLQKVKTGVDCIYNFEFEEANQVYFELKQKYPKHPFTKLYNAICMYWEYFPVTPESKYHNEYVSSITEAINYTENVLDKKESSEAIFFNLMSRLLIMQYYADNNLSSKVIPHVSRAYKMVTRGFTLKDKITDFYLSTGIYNYYREAYPEAHPIYKPVAYFFPEGDIKLGIKQLEYNWKNGIFLSTESLFFLTYIYLNFEKDYSKSFRYAKQLHKQFPQNPLYLSYKIRLLLIQEKYTTALAMVNKLKKLEHTNDYFQIVSDIYLGIIYEKKFKKIKKASKLYSNAISRAGNYGNFINNDLSYAYFGLSRIYDKDKKRSKQFRKIAVDIASYPHINFN